MLHKTEHVGWLKICEELEEKTYNRWRPFHQFIFFWKKKRTKPKVCLYSNKKQVKEVLKPVDDHSFPIHLYSTNVLKWNPGNLRWSLTGSTHTILLNYWFFFLRNRLKWLALHPAKFKASNDFSVLNKL